MENLFNTLLLFGLIMSGVEGIFRGGVKRFANAAALILAVVAAPVFLLPAKGYVIKNSKLYVFLLQKFGQIQLPIINMNIANAFVCMFAFWLIYIVFLIMVRIMLSSGKIFTGIAAGSAIDCVLGFTGGVVGYSFKIMLGIATVVVFSFLPIVRIAYGWILTVPILAWMAQHNIILTIFTLIFH